MGLIVVGIMIGLALSDHDATTIDYISSLAAWAQVITSGGTLYLAYFVFTQWKTQLHYPRYIEEVSKTYDAFEEWHNAVSEFYWWTQGDKKNASS